ncbi:MAG: serine/threonine protein kinase [Armatimonadetes bacterium]|nr:serine/threonine protein kinase [Armatimonadota bacterium]
MTMQLADFDLQQEIGRGGMGVVYRARQKSLGRDVAVKVLPEDLAREGQVAARFRTEAQRMAKLGHRGIAQVFMVGEESGTQYFAMEYLSGGCLEDRLRQGPLPLDAAVQIAAQVAEALDYAHERGVVHRDIKPANIMFSEQGQPVVTDFGIAKALDDSRLTATGMALGTPHYMAPEQAKGNPVDGRADLYALGAVLYEMVCGRPPFQGDSPLSVVMKQISEPPLSPRAVAPTVPSWLESIILRALEKEPTHRFARAGDMAKALRSGAAVPVPTLTQAVAPPPGGPGETVVLPPPRSAVHPVLYIVLLACAFLGIAIVVAALLLRPPRLPTDDGSVVVTNDLAEEKGGDGNTKGPTLLPSPTGFVSVPNTLGQQVADAERLLRDELRLNPRVKSERYSAKYGAGTVCAQNPRPGQQVERGDVVYLVPSQGFPSLDGVRSAVSEYEAAYEARNPSRFVLGCYAPDAQIYSNQRWYNRDQYYSHEAELMPRMTWASVEISGLSVEPVDGDVPRAKAVFEQRVTNSLGTDSRKAVALTYGYEDSKWQIIRDETR